MKPHGGFHCFRELFGESGSIIRQVYFESASTGAFSALVGLWFVEPALMELVLLCGQCVAR